MASVRGVRVEVQRLIRAPVSRVWHLLSRVESHPRFARLWLAADPLERSQGAVIAEFRGFFGGLPVTSVQRVAFRPPGRIEFRQIRGTLRALSGAYVLTDADGETLLAAELSADPGIVFFSEAAVRQILAAHLDAMAARLKASAERDLVRLTLRRGLRPAQAAAENGGAPVDGAPAAPPRQPSGAEPARRPAGPDTRRRRRRRRRHTDGAVPPGQGT